MSSSEPVNLLEMTLPALRKWLEEELREPRFRADQVWQWIWQKLVRNFGEMTNVSVKLRRKLEELAVIKWPELLKTQESADGVKKLLLGLEDGARIETVLIPAENRRCEIRWSQCLSTQVGCPMGCQFCATGQLGFKRNLSMGEILGQVLWGRQFLDDVHPDRPVVRNLVFMGMGEPLLNLSALMPALECLHEEGGANFSSRRITVSTCGLGPELRELGESGLAYLAVSLHAPTQEIREKIMPRAAQWPLDKMMAALANYPLKARERVTFEYLLLGGVNDRPEHARQLARLLNPIKAKLNLIIYNRVAGLPFCAPEPEAVEAFQKILWEKNITAILRKSRGSDISAACGQLAAADSPVP